MDHRHATAGPAITPGPERQRPRPPVTWCTRQLDKFDACIANEVVPAIHRDCGGDGGLIWAAGSSIGAFNALSMVCRHPDMFGTAICMSGTYNMNKFLEGEMTRDYYDSSPLDFVPDLAGKQLELLKQRFILLAHGQGDFEEPEQSWKVEQVLGPKGIPNRVDAWSKDWRHDWVTWRKMLPQFLGEFLPSTESPGTGSPGIGSPSHGSPGTTDAEADAERLAEATPSSPVVG